MPILGATAQVNRLQPSSDFLIWLGQGQYAYSLFDDGTQLVLKGNMQRSNASALPLERMAVGGVNTVRGYRENQLVRDEGFSSSVEVHYPVFREQHHQLFVVPFMDYGAAWNKAQKGDYLHSAGVGLNWRFDSLTTEFYWAHALSYTSLKQHSDPQDDGFHFQVKVDAF